MAPIFDMKGATIYHGDAIDVLRHLPDGIAHSCITSPPYFMQRAYLPDGHPDACKEVGRTESLPDYIERLVSVFKDVRRVLRDDGTLWVIIGDSHAGAGWSNHANTGGTRREDGGRQRHVYVHGIRPKNLIMVPFRFAIA